MPEQYDIKETKEALVATIALGRFVAERLKDGADWGDAMALGQKLLDPQFRQLVQDGAEGADKIPAELKDLSLLEGVELLQAVSSAFNKAA